MDYNPSKRGILDGEQIWHNILGGNRNNFLEFWRPLGGGRSAPLSFFRNCFKFCRNLVTFVDWFFNIRNYASIEPCLSKIRSSQKKLFGNSGWGVYGTLMSSKIYRWKFWPEFTSLDKIRTTPLRFCSKKPPIANCAPITFLKPSLSMPSLRLF